MTKQRAEINSSGAKIKSIAEFLINGANGSFTYFDRKKTGLLPLLTENGQTEVKYARGM